MHERDSEEAIFLSPSARDYMDGLRKEGLIVKRDTDIKHLNNSPLYYTIRLILIVYLVTFILTIIYNTSDLLFCYLQAPIHNVRIRNTSLPTETQGFLFNISTYVSGKPSPHYLQGYLTNVNIVSLEPYGLSPSDTANTTEDKANYLINTKLNDSPRLVLGTFPMAIVMNGTNSIDPTDNICLSTLKFVTFPRAAVRPTDGGTAASFDIINPNRKRIWINSMWYTFSYWSSVETIYNDDRFTEKQKKEHHIPKLDEVPKTNYYCTAQISNILPSQYNKSNVPIWFMNLSEASTSRLKGKICADDYGMIINLSTWFCISPLLIYDLRLKRVELQDIRFNGNLILDFRIDNQKSTDIFSCISPEERAKPYTLLLNNSTLRIMTITKDLKKLIIESHGQSNLTFTIPKRVLTCEKGINISLGENLNAKDPCRLEFSGISGESYFTGDFHRYYSARYIAPLDKIDKLEIVVNISVLPDLTLTFPFCNQKITPSFPLKVLDARNNDIFSLDYVDEENNAKIIFNNNPPTQEKTYFSATVACEQDSRSFTLTLAAHHSQ